MDEVRAPLENEFSQAIDFLNHHLRPGYSWSIADEYPLTLQLGNRNNLFYIKEQDQIASMAALKTFLLKSPAGLFKVAGIGSVVTNPHFRHMGYSKKVLERVLAEAHHQACDIAILWTDLYEFYRKLGFELAGKEVSLKFDKPFHAEPGPGVRHSQGANVSPEAITRLYTHHTCGCIRSAEDIRKSLRIPNSHVFTAWNAQGQLEAYAVVGKGADLTGYIHEWGGGVSKLIPLISHITKTLSGPITLIVPGHSTNLIRKLEPYGGIRHDGVLGMIKIVNSELLFAKILRYARNMGHGDFLLERRGQIYVFGSGQSLFQTDSERDIVRMLFGPSKPSELAPLDPELATMLDGLFPIPFWIWGWDSV